VVQLEVCSTCSIAVSLNLDVICFQREERFIDHYGVWERTWTKASLTTKANEVRRQVLRDGTIASENCLAWLQRNPLVVANTLFGNITDLATSCHHSMRTLKRYDDSCLSEQYVLLEEGC